MNIIIINYFTTPIYLDYIMFILQHSRMDKEGEVYVISSIYTLLLILFSNNNMMIIYYYFIINIIVIVAHHLHHNSRGKR